ncbi:Ribokinase-like protein [Dendryphion nanum]|uniref:Ribokinase-like protein n=1 Tax=Dendryphion nanum TaxID=256645 RepID=A0A9P9J1Z9_9PLEO|nr:Ribokinase-like protein [Dendryphion nanum]
MASAAPDVLGVSLGMVIIDEIRIPNKESLIDIIGGSGTFVTLGQRIFANNPLTVGCLVVAGEDFPKDIESGLQKLGVKLVLKRKEGENSSRGLLKYKDDTFGAKSFTYTCGPLRASPKDLEGTTLLGAKAVHFFATPEEILVQVPELVRLREQRGTVQRPLVVWEPLPASCKVENMQKFVDACKLVDVFSPNHLEMVSLFTDNPATGLSGGDLEGYGEQLLKSPIGPTGDGILIVRSGEYGSLSMSSSSRAKWLPPFYEVGSSKVVDPTGAGNTFLGGYIFGWHATHSQNEAIYHGHVAASYALEQIGLPILDKEGDQELWNGVAAMDRLAEYKARLREREVKSICFI